MVGKKTLQLLWCVFPLLQSVDAVRVICVNYGCTIADTSIGRQAKRRLNYGIGIREFFQYYTPTQSNMQHQRYKHSTVFTQQ